MVWIGWISYSLSIFFLAISALYFYRQFTRLEPNDPVLQLFAFRGTELQQKRIRLSLAPQILLNAFCWPIVFLLYFVRVIKVVVKNPSLMEDQATDEEFNKHFIDSVRQQSQQSSMVGGSLISPIFAGFLILLLSQVDSLRWPMTVWLISIWVAWMAWLASSFLTVGGFVKLARLNPKYILLNSASLILLFAVCVPVVTAVVILSLEGSSLAVSPVWEAVKKIYTINGIVWKGPESTYLAISRNPLDIFYVATGVLIYSVILSKLPAAAIRRKNSDDFYFAASTALIQGQPEIALVYLQKEGRDSLDSAVLRIVANLMKSDVSAAQDIAAAKFPAMREYVPNQEIAPLLVLVTLCFFWETPQSVSEEIFNSFCLAGPSEAELLVIYMALLKGGPGLQGFVTPKLCKIAEERGYESFSFVVSLAEKDLKVLKELFVRMAAISSVSVGVSSLIYVFRWLLECTSNPSIRETKCLMVADQLYVAAQYATSGADVFLVFISTKMASEISHDPSGSAIQAFTKVEDKIHHVLSLRPWGPEFSKLLLEINVSNFTVKFT
ncbi:hypothetical protein DQ400_15835 [Vreelandella sulfidaeris]|uniref:Uncharacterized protein n=1 Tax=Vreelandella sulfidaeris TaxID=115553 RepID=A0A365TMF2_9GAMM|nr:hypothetical protein [Halomonas sulfidaeris]RBI65934.1 hypothetical protein DQ400_15835 [Halomonas sulfidaeris]